MSGIYGGGGSGGGGGGTISGTVIQYDVIVGVNATTVGSVGPGAAGDVLVSGGNAANPSYVTPTAGTGLTITENASTHQYALSVPVVEANGGTHQTTYTTGDILYASAANTLSKLAIGSSTQVLTVTAGVPAWAPASGAVTSVTGTANQITSSPTTGAVTLTIPSTFIAPGSIESTTTLKSDGIFTTASGQVVKITTPGAYPYTTLTSDFVILVDSSAARTIVPLGSPTTGQMYRIKDNVGSAALNNITITPSGKNIDGSASVLIQNNYGSIDIVYNGTQWNVL